MSREEKRDEIKREYCGVGVCCNCLARVEVKIPYGVTTREFFWKKICEQCGCVYYPAANANKAVPW